MIKRYYFSVKVFFIVVLLSLTQINYAQQDSISTDDLLNLSFADLMKIEVFSSNKKSESIIETPAVINVVTAEDIKMLNFNTLEQVLEYSVGLASINGEGNVFTTTTIRGNTLVNYNTNTLLLYDGIPLFNAYHGSFDFQSIPLSSIDRIEIVKGSNSVLYGSNAVNGVINIISKKVKDDELIASGRIKYGSFNSLYSSASILKKNNDWTFSLFTDVTTNQGETLPFTDESGQQLDLKKKYKGISTASNISYKNLSLDLQYYNRNLPGVRTRGFSTAYSSTSDTVGILKPEHSDEYAFVANLRYFKDISDKLTFNIRSNIMDWHLNKQMVDGYWDYSSFGIYNDADLTLKTNDKFSNKIGISYNHYIGRRYKSQKDAYDIGKNNIWTDDFAIFLNGEYQILESLKIFYGGRYYYAKYDDKTFNNFSPRLALTYTPIENLYLKAIYGQSFRIPTYFEKEVKSSKVIGNPNLLPERSTSYDFVISSIVKSIQFDIDLFYSEINDKIARVTAPNDPTKKTNLNVGNISLTGIEFNSKYRVKKNLYGFLGYSYTMGKDLETGNKLEYVFDNMVNFGANIQALDWLNVNTSAKYLSKWGEADPYLLLNMGINLKPSKDLPLLIEFKVDNIFDTDVYLPEIARRKATVPTIPKTFNRMLFIGLSYNL